MQSNLSYVIKYVEGMDRAAAFYRDVLGLPVKSQHPGWTEFATGDTVLALHSASEKCPAGTVELHFSVPDVQTFYDTTQKQVKFSGPPARQSWGSTMTQLLDPEGSYVTVSSS
jgi:lactoylglutathione lyase